MQWKLGMPRFLRSKARLNPQFLDYNAKWQEASLPGLTEEHHLDRYQRASRLIC